MSFIQVDTTWSNDFVLNSSVVVFPDVTLSIVGARIDFENDASIGLQTNATVIIEDSEFHGPDGNGIEFLNEDPASVMANNWVCSNMKSCISRQCCWGNRVELYNSIFKNNVRSLRGYSGYDLLADNCLFLGHEEEAVGGADYYFQGCVFANNTMAINGERFTIKDSIFMYNVEAIVDPNGYADYMDNVVFYRNVIAILPNCCFNDLSGFSSVSFIENEIAIQANKPFESSIARTNFINNSFFHIEYSGLSSWDAENLYWGTTDVEEIGTYIFDIFDDPTVGFVSIEPVAQEPFLHSLYRGGEGPWIPPFSHLGEPIIPQAPAVTMPPDTAFPTPDQDTTFPSSSPNPDTTPPSALVTFSPTEDMETLDPSAVATTNTPTSTLEPMIPDTIPTITGRPSSDSLQSTESPAPDDTQKTGSESSWCSFMNLWAPGGWGCV